MAEQDLFRAPANGPTPEATSATADTPEPVRVQETGDQQDIRSQYSKHAASTNAKNGLREVLPDSSILREPMERLNVQEPLPPVPSPPASTPEVAASTVEKPPVTSAMSSPSVSSSSQQHILSEPTRPGSSPEGEAAAGHPHNKAANFAGPETTETKSQEPPTRRPAAASSLPGEASSSSTTTTTTTTRTSSNEPSDPPGDSYQPRHTRSTHQHRSEMRRQGRGSSSHYQQGSSGGAGRGQRQGYGSQGSRGQQDVRGEGRQGARQQANMQQRLERAMAVEGPSAPAPSTDLERFLVQVTPMLQLDQTQPQEQAMCDLLLEDVWRFYSEPSLYGREVYTLGGQRGPSLSYFVPFLSAMQLYVPASPGDPGTRRLYVSDVEGWPKHMHLVYQYFEKEMPFNRTPMYSLIQSLSTSQHDGQAGSVLMQTRIAQLHPASWFAVAWYPVYRIPDAPLCARFLTFHSFAPLVMSIMKASHAQHQPAEHREPQLAQPVVALQVIGLQWYNMQNERWFDNITDVPDITSSPEPGVASPSGSSDGIASPSGQQPSDGDAPGRTAGSNGGLPPSGTGRGGQRAQRPAVLPSATDYMWQAHISELQATADRLARGIGVRVLGQMGAEEANLTHPDYEFFKLRN